MRPNIRNVAISSRGRTKGVLRINLGDVSRCEKEKKRIKVKKKREEEGEGDEKREEKKEKKRGKQRTMEMKVTCIRNVETKERNQFTEGLMREEGREGEAVKLTNKFQNSLLNSLVA